MRYHDRWGRNHRIDGPAIDEDNGHRGWYIHGKLHRIDGPAYETSDGYKAWWVNDNRHCTTGPARTWANGDKQWFINNVKLPDDDIPQTKEEWVIAILKYG